MNVKKIKLSDNDKKIIVNHSNICTDSHGKSCSEILADDKNK